MRDRGWMVLLVVGGIMAASHADQVVVKNGDRVSGSVLRSDKKQLVVKTEYAGEVTIAWTAVQQLTSDQRLHVTLANGQTVMGRVATRDGRFEIAAIGVAPVATPKENIVQIRNDAEQSAYEQSLHPRLTENWEAAADVGFTLTRGNSQTKNLALSFKADRKTFHDKLHLYANSVYATNDAPGAVPSTTANSEQGGTRYDHDLSPKAFGFVGADFDADSLQTLDLRSVFGAGLGYHAIKKESSTLDFLAGANYTHEAYTAFSRTLAAATIGDEFMRKLPGNTVLNQSFYFFPDLTNTGEYRGTFTFSTVTKISKWLGWQNSYNDIYLSNPPAGKRNNDVVVTTGLNITLLHAGSE